MKKTYLRKCNVPNIYTHLNTHYTHNPVNPVKRSKNPKSGQGAKSFLRMSDSETKQRKKKKKSKKVLSEDSLEDFREKKAKRGVVRFFYLRFFFEESTLKRKGI